MCCMYVLRNTQTPRHYIGEQNSYQKSRVINGFVIAKLIEPVN